MSGGGFGIETTYGIDQKYLRELLGQAGRGQVQLPDFQRDWVWDDQHVRSLLASVSLTYPIGTLMILRTGADGLRFKQRPLQGVQPPAEAHADRLILDGQQRLTAFYQALMCDEPVVTRDDRGNQVKRWYYINMAAALDPKADREEAVVSLPEDKVRRFSGTKPSVDFSTREREYEGRYFPFNRIFDSPAWRRAFSEYWNYDRELVEFWDQFEIEVVKRFEQYLVPVIELAAETPKEAVCKVFEKVNTSNVTLTVFDLLTASFAADDFDLRDAWQRVRARLDDHPVLEDFSPTDFLQAITLLASWEQRSAAAPAGGEERTGGIGCKRADMLRLSLEGYRRCEDKVVLGLQRAARFLHTECIFDPEYLPYGGQLIPLSAILAALGDRWEIQGTRDKLARWLWCGILGELYGGTTETRFARDLPDVLAWVEGGPEPRTVVEAVFAPDRLLSLRTRNSAAYKGIYALLLQEGARDLRTGEKAEVPRYFEERVDIHHVFPKNWCRDRGLPPAQWDSVINKTPLAARTNRMIGSSAPSRYLDSMANSAKTSSGQIDAHLRSHLISPASLRANNFDGFIETRRKLLLERIALAMGQPPDAYT